MLSLRAGNPEEDSKKIAQLLKHGAHCLADLGAAAEQSDAFAAEGIDAILQARLVLLGAKKDTRLLQQRASTPSRQAGLCGWVQVAHFNLPSREPHSHTAALAELRAHAPHPSSLPQGRTEKRQIGGRAGNTFSVATFALGGSEVGSVEQGCEGWMK